MQAIREVLDRVEGRPAISIGGVPGEPIEVAGNIIPAHLTTPEERSEYVNKRLIQLLRGWMNRSGYDLFARKRKKPRTKQGDS